MARSVFTQLSNFSKRITIFTFMDATNSDINTQNLWKVIARYPDTKASIHQVDFADISAVHEFASKISSTITAGEYPSLQSIICNAAYWNLFLNSEFTVDGYDKPLQVNHISHVALVLRLIGNFADEGRIVLLSSVSHYRKPNPMTSHLPEIPDDIEQLNHPHPNNDKKDRAFQRYANSKLIITTWMYSLDRYLQQDPMFKNITVVVIDPGVLGDSRASTTNTPRSLRLLQSLVLKPLMSVISRLFDPTLRSSAEAGVDVAELAVNKAPPW